MPEIFAFFLYLSFITFINYNLIKKNHKYLGNSNLFTICIRSLLFSYLYTIYIYIKISSLKRKFEKIEQQEQEAAKQNERIEEERRRQEYLKSPEYKKIKERKLVFENLLTIPGLSEDIINCLFDKCPTKHAIINSSIEALAEVPGISNNLAKAIHARLKKT
jgi:ERCC4-type nuclease